jgi:hypothetical protein
MTTSTIPYDALATLAAELRSIAERNWPGDADAWADLPHGLILEGSPDHHRVRQIGEAAWQLCLEADKPRTPKEVSLGANTLLMRCVALRAAFPQNAASDLDLLACGLGFAVQNDKIPDAIGDALMSEIGFAWNGIGDWAA